MEKLWLSTCKHLWQKQKYIKANKKAVGACAKIKYDVNVTCDLLKSQVI